MTANGSALCRCGIRIPFSPELKPNKDINDNDKNQKLGYVLLPEPQPTSEPLLIGLPSATLVQNALLVAVFGGHTQKNCPTIKATKYTGKHNKP
jgi:hypothetical protein